MVSSDLTSGRDFVVPAQAHPNGRHLGNIMKPSLLDQYGDMQVHARFRNCEPDCRGTSADL